MGNTTREERVLRMRFGIGMSSREGLKGITLNQRLSKTLEITNKRMLQLEKDNSDLETENESLQKQMESFRMSSKKLE